MLAWTLAHAAATLVALAALAATSDATIPEVFVPGLPDTGMAAMTWLGPVILYNPDLYRAAGPARGFVRAHELAHVALGHLHDARARRTAAGRAAAEAAADCVAARRASPLAVAAMVRLLLRLPPEARDAIYGTKAARARRIAACAGGPAIALGSAR